MVSIRRRRLLTTCSGQNSLLVPHPLTFNNGCAPVVNKASGVCPLPLNDSLKPKEKTTTEMAPGSSSVSAFSPSKEHCFQSFPEVKRRKQHRRKHVDNQEPCIMRGVYFKNLKWQAAIKVDKKQIHLGTVSSQEEAARLYDRAAFMCGREPNFELSMEEKEELRKIKWDEFLAITRSAITSKKSHRRAGVGLRGKVEDHEWEVEEAQNGSSVSEDDEAAAW
ncbi:ethylene-responsive transcription factor-like protein At4g13040 [Andrographis paniculata]|uniref:ethylene-responsive transcription factor-like protein At4g13040 n=1 Tax=Andrographis paniculata TaxID=175694 RepID=UPI0021E877C7|nr:ethylene-responsive transcription factor-like protein At4g13040 [Andrographis paniculata]